MSKGHRLLDLALLLLLFTEVQLICFPDSSVGKESACSAGDPSSIPGSARSAGEGIVPTPVFWPGEFHGLYSPWGRKESDMTERHPHCTQPMRNWV